MEAESPERGTTALVRLLDHGLPLLCGVNLYRRHCTFFRGGVVGQAILPRFGYGVRVALSLAASPVPGQGLGSRELAKDNDGAWNGLKFSWRGIGVRALTRQH